MEKSQSAGNLNGVIFPKLTRCRTTKLNVERHTAVVGQSLESEVTESISIALQEADGVALPEGAPKLRIMVTISFEGIWRDKETQALALTFNGEYEGLSPFPPNATVADVNSFLEIKLYRDILIAQTYPIARSRMAATIQEVGINSRRDLGYDLHNTTEAVEATI